MPLSKFEANPTLRLRVKRAFFSSFPLASSCLNDYFRVYAILDFLAKQLIFLNTVTCLSGVYHKPYPCTYRSLLYPGF